jgi:hypothetical protein
MANAVSESRCRHRIALLLTAALSPLSAAIFAVTVLQAAMSNDWIATAPPAVDPRVIVTVVVTCHTLVAGTVAAVCVLYASPVRIALRVTAAMLAFLVALLAFDALLVRADWWLAAAFGREPIFFRI